MAIIVWGIKYIIFNIKIMHWAQIQTGNINGEKKNDVWILFFYQKLDFCILIEKNCIKTESEW